MRVVVLLGLLILHGVLLRPIAHAPELGDVPRPDHALVASRAPETIEELRAELTRITTRDGIMGASVAIVDRTGPIWVGGAGLRDAAAQAPADADTAFRVGSLSKSVIALAVMRLVDQGKLDVDRPLAEYMPGVVENPWESVAPVTLAQCMEHTAALDDIRFNEIYSDDEREPIATTLARNPRSRVARWRPGTRHAYSNVGYTVAARAIEIASGEPFDVYVRREVLVPMGIVDAAFERTPLIASRLAVGYEDDHAPIAFRAFAHRPSASLLISATELAKLVHFWIVRGAGYPPIVSAAGLARIERSATLPYPRVASEYGFANYADVSHPYIAHGHDGGMPGFHASYRYFSQLGIGYVVLVNANYSFRGYFAIRSLLYSYLTREARPVEPAPIAEPERPGADYFAYGSPHTALFEVLDRASRGWSIRRTGAALELIGLDGASSRLVPAGDGGYRERWECGSSHRFTTTADGTAVLTTGYQYWEAASGTWARVRYIGMRAAFWLVAIAPVSSLLVLVIAALKRRRPRTPLALLAWPALAGMSCIALPHLLFSAFADGVIGDVHPSTIAICILTIIFGISSVMTLGSSLCWSVRRDRPPWRYRWFAMLCGIAFVGLALMFAASEWIGLRTWAY